jgi:hypothetical protein
MTGLARAVGTPNLGSAGTTGFTPILWSSKLQQKLYGATVYGDIANTDYEGEISAKGDKVVIRTVPTLTIRDYVVGGGLTYEKPTSDSIELVVDKAKYFAFEVNNIEAYQSDLKLMDEFSTDGGEQMKMHIDTDLLGSHYAQCADANAGDAAGVKSGAFNMGKAGAPVLINKANIVDYIVDCGSILDEQNVPVEGRYIVLPAWMNGMLKKSDLRDASVMGDATSVIRNGLIGMVDRFKVYSSNHLSTVDDVAAGKQATNVLFGHKKGITFASQMTSMETLSNPTDFGKLIRGLNVYGSSVIDPNAIGHLYAARG